MNYPLTDSLLGRQRNRNWVPLVTQQCRLRHVHQIFAFNLPPLKKNTSYYFTLHLTSMSAPFYTSEMVDSINPKWQELDQRNLPNSATSALVIRIWCHSPETSDNIISTWGVNLSGLVYLGGKIAEIQPSFFTCNSVIFHMRGGYFTSHKVINWDASRSPPFAENLILTDTDRKLYRRVTVQCSVSDVRDSYNLEKLRKLQSLQVTIKNKCSDVQSVKDKIEVKCGASHLEEKSPTREEERTSSQYNVRYATQLLTMNSLNKMLEEKPTKMQRKEMMKVRNEIEIAQFRSKLLSHERDKKSALIRRYKHKLKELVDKNEEKNMELMDSYYKLSKEVDKFKELKKEIIQNQEALLTLHSQLFHRQRQLMQQLLFIYPIERTSEKKYTIHGIYLPNSDILSDCSDVGISVALGYVTHVILMCSSFLQVPLRYTLTHYGSRSSVMDNISHMLPDKERDFPLFTKGKDKMQFTYAVYLLNKNIAQLRWLVFMHTPELKATLPNLLSLLQSPEAKEVCCLVPSAYADTAPEMDNLQKSLADSSLGSIATSQESVPDEGRLNCELSRKYISKMCKSNECGPGLSEILAIPEAFMSRQISVESFKSYGALKRSGADSSMSDQIVIKEGRVLESNQICDSNAGDENIEQGTDLLDPVSSLAAFSESCRESLEANATDSPSDKQCDAECKRNGEANKVNEQCVDIGKISTLLDDDATTSSDSASVTSTIQTVDSPLTARTDALLHTKSFNLVKPKPNL